MLTQTHTDIEGPKKKNKVKRLRKKKEEEQPFDVNTYVQKQLAIKEGKKYTGDNAKGMMEYGPMSLAMKGEEIEDNENFFEPISYRKLIKMISTLHPVDHETKNRFAFGDRVEVKDYYAKLSDVCCCYAVTKYFKETIKAIKKRFRKNKVKFERPESMADLPSSDSTDSQDEDEKQSKGLTQLSQSLGDGATLYLQMMKTIAIMMLLLTIMNIPIYILYEKSTINNDISNLSVLFKYFTLGNLG